MGYRRIKSDKTCIYHLTSRVVHQHRLLADEQREVWVEALHRAVRFSGIELITYCCMQNHFHVLARIDPATKNCDDTELVSRFGALYGSEKAAWCGLDAPGLAHALAQGETDEAERLRGRLRARMGDVSEFMRTLRQRYTKWFNRTYNTGGTLWAERFGSVLVQDTPWLVALVAAYIDLNPVRAGLAALPEGYRWSGYTEALAGRAGLRQALSACFPRAGGEMRGLAEYRLLMLGKGAAGKRDGKGARIDRAALLEAIQKGGELETHELLQLQLQFISKGVALGSLDWLSKGEGGKALKQMRKPLVPAALEHIENGNLAVAQSRYRRDCVAIPSAQAIPLE